MMIYGLLICCCLLLNSGLTKPDCGEKLTFPETCNESKYWESRVNLLPFYTSGFE